MKLGITFLILVSVVNSCVSQREDKSDLELVLEKNISRIEFSKLSFFAKELIHLGADTSFQAKFKRKLTQHNNIKRRTVSDQKEYDLTLHLLYNSLVAEKNIQPKEQEGKKFLLELLDEKREINFSVTENLIIEQIDGSMRGLANGYDEGTIDRSTFVFFCYNPLLYKQALIRNNLSDDWNRTGIFLCNYLRENENPVAIRNPIKEEIINILTGNDVQDEFRDIIKDIAECDVLVNLFD